MDNTNQFVIFGGVGGHPDYRSNIHKPRKGRFVDQTECCAYCGRYTPSPKYYLYLTTANEVIEARDDSHDDLGFYPIGSECKKLALEAGKPLYNADYKRVTR